MSVSSFAGAAGGLQPYEQIFTSSGTWTKPTGVKTVEITVVGGSAGTPTTGGLSAPGAYIKKIADVSALTSVPITVGAAGAIAGSGGISSFGLLATAGGSVYGSGRSGAVLSSGLGTIVALSSTVNMTANSAISYANGFYFQFIYGPSNTTFIGKGNTPTSFTSYTLPVALSGNSYAGLNGRPLEVIYGNGYYAFYDHGNTNVYYSTDGQTWLVKAAPTAIYGLTFGAGKFVAINAPGTTASIYTTTNFASWTTAATLTLSTGCMTGIYFLNNVFMFTDQLNGFNSGFLKYSLDAVTWSTGNTQFGTQNPGSPGPLLYSALSGKYYHIMTYNNFGGTNGAQFASQGSDVFTLNTSTGVMTTSSMALIQYGLGSMSFVPRVLSDGNIWYSNKNDTTVSNLWRYSVVANTWSQPYQYTADSNYSCGIIEVAANPGQIYDFTTSTTSRFVQINNGTLGDVTQSSASSGAGGPGVTLYNAGNIISIPGPGIEGWASGAAVGINAGYGSTLPSSDKYGSGVAAANPSSSAGIQGVVRVRWWA